MGTPTEMSRNSSPLSRREIADARPPVTHEQIALAAYYRAERRDFAPGLELEDWLEAERELIATTTNLARGVR
jgi:hypothetical protein